MLLLLEDGVLAGVECLSPPSCQACLEQMGEEEGDIR